MLATFGLERLEAGLAENTVTASDVAEFLASAEPIDVRTLAREGMPEALDCLHRRVGHITDELADRPVDAETTTDPLLTAALISGPGPPGVPRQRHNRSRANRQFGPPQHADRV
ncbi:hypothetical protein [Candidatus Mycobacterium methanotrophicum]|uniref:Uncharacterized protein n=1 Tax=Candidatus Mycobacterium methanotrophicum TaxID=2943498 RepID=A0ABY4QS74_9MYCO|nr:hypothetical protein [Candidatus Mycobacterium methanotrophicum]UQX12856.1 hypothetical protein M5I08_01335 [Candidatus Mycobacterium methanotrophicum]